MSSFKNKAAQVEKKKVTRSTKKTGQETSPTSEKDPALDEQTESVATDSIPEDIVTAEVVETNNELYGEEQENDQSKPKWERMIPLDRIRPNPFQPRKTFNQDKLNELAGGMKVHGWIGGGLPVRAATDEANTYEMVWGERRWRSASIAKLKAIPCVISTYSDDDMIEKGLLENIQREDLTNLEEGLAYVSLLTLKTESGKPRYSIRRLATQIGKDKSYIEERLKYARVPVNVQQLAIDQPDISPRIIHELGELAKELQPEELEPVIQGVRAGKLRIEDVREIRQDVEQAKQEPQTQETQEASSPEPTYATAVEPSGAIEQISHTPVSVVTDTISTKEQAGESGHESDPTAPSIETSHRLPEQPALTPPVAVTPLASTVIISVFEKTLKRDNEALERIFQRIVGTFETLTPDEQSVLRRYVQRWSASLQDLMSRVEPPLVSEEAE